MRNPVVLAVGMSKQTPSSSMAPRFKIYLVPDDEFCLTESLDLNENTNLWWVDLNVFSEAYFEDKAREDARKAKADAARAAQEPQPEPAPPPITMDDKRESMLGELHEKIPGKLKGGIGHYKKGTGASCEKREGPYLAGTGESSFNMAYILSLTYSFKSKFDVGDKA